VAIPAVEKAEIIDAASSKRDSSLDTGYRFRVTPFYVWLIDVDSSEMHLLLAGRSAETP